MPGLYIAIACILALIAAMEVGRRLLYRFDKMHWLTGTTFWFGLAWVMAAVTSLVVGSVVDWVIWTVVMALGQTLIMSCASWIILKFRFRGRAIIRSWVLAGISLAAGCFTIWKVSFFLVSRAT
jgi:hypothetical protein